MTEAHRRPGPSRIAWILLAFGLAAVVLVVLLYAARRQIAREAVTGWLRSKGVASESTFEELGPGRLVGRVRIGSAQAPDLTVERVEVGYSLGSLLAGRGVQVTSIRLTRPVLRAQWRGGGFSAGAVDSLIDILRQRPPRPGEPSPQVEVDDGRVRLATDYGELSARGSALVRDSRLVRLDATSAPARLAGAGLTADLGPGVARGRVAGGVLDLDVKAPFSSLRTTQGALRDGMLGATVRSGYPDDRQGARGAATVVLTAAALDARGVAARGLSVSARARDLQWTRSGGEHVAGDIALSVEAQGLDASNARFTSAVANFAGDFAASRTVRLRLTGSAEGRGGWHGFGAPAAGDSPEIATLKRGLRAFRVSAQGIGLEVAQGHLSSRLAGPVRLLPDAGGEVRLVPAGGGYRLTSRGGGLPGVEADVQSVRFAAGGAVARGRVRAALSVGPVQGADIDAAGSLRVADGAATFAASRCVEATAAKFTMGQNDVQRLAGRFCPDRQPMLKTGRGGWTVAGRAEQASAEVPFLQARLAEAAGPVRLADSGGRLSARLALASGRVDDTAPDVRFRPLRLSGEVQLARDLWTGAFDARTPKGTRIAHAVLRHGADGKGSVEVSTDMLRFAPDGLQPTDISPLAEPLGSGVAGSAQFAGGFRWTPEGSASEGRLAIRALDFKSPAGQVSGLSAEVRFSSLAPLTAPPGQVVRIARIEAAVPVTDVSASLALQEQSLVVTGGQATMGGGRLRIERMEVPLKAGEPISGAVGVEGVQLHDLVEASPFGDRVDLDARVSGRIPFRAQGGKVTIAGGDLHAIAPGRLSISRAALTSVSAQGSIQAPSPAAPMATTDTFTDFAYQALENLAFDKLDAGVNTRTDGRLGVQFHIVGRHDPPKPQEITISWLDLIRRRFLGRKLPLPSGTGVDLTLDTTLNLDDLLKDYADFERLRSSPQVQR